MGRGTGEGDVDMDVVSCHVVGNVVAEVKHARWSTLGAGVPRTDRFQFSYEANTSACRTTRASCEERGAGSRFRVGGKES